MTEGKTNEERTLIAVIRAVRPSADLSKLDALTGETPRLDFLEGYLDGVLDIARAKRRIAVG
jgi:hypothetical protein